MHGPTARLAHGATTWTRAHSPTGTAFVTLPSQQWIEPQTLRQANNSNAAAEWREARQVEYDRLMQMGTWKLVEPPPGANILGCKWVFKHKFKPDGSLERYKARLVAQGFGQIEGIDFDETFAPTAGRPTVRAFLAKVCNDDLHLHQLDVTTAFLYGEVDKEIYMRQPPEISDGTSRVCKLVRSIYGLKQAPRIWSELLEQALVKLGFVKSTLDPSLYILYKDGQSLYLLDFVDDMLLATSSLGLLSFVKQALMTEFKITDLGEAQRYVGIYIHRDRPNREMWLHQAPFCLAMAERFGCHMGPFPDHPMTSTFVLDEPWEMGHKGEGKKKGEPTLFPPSTEPVMDPQGIKEYQQIIGSLNYVTTTTRPDVGNAVAKLSRVMARPKARHFDAAKRVVGYLAGTSDWAIHFEAQAQPLLECFVDANYGGDPSHKSFTGLVLKLCGGPIHWAARKQDRISTSTCDAEAQACMTAVQYVENVRDLLSELGMIQAHPTPLYNDNSATITLCRDAKAHKRSVHLTRPMAYVRERTRLGIISPTHIPSRNMPADFLTKTLVEEAFTRGRSLAGLQLLPFSIHQLLPPAAAEPASVDQGVEASSRGSVKNTGQ
jgi:Reverse transcriptase (RNA-dependent DNA polymerase)